MFTGGTGCSLTSKPPIQTTKWREADKIKQPMLKCEQRPVVCWAVGFEQDRFKFPNARCARSPAQGQMPCDLQVAVDGKESFPFPPESTPAYLLLGGLGKILVFKPKEKARTVLGCVHAALPSLKFEGSPVTRSRNSDENGH